MPTKRLSNMTAQEFIEFKGALGLSRKQLAAALGRRGPTITGYEQGNPIPMEVAEKLNDLFKHEWERMQARGLIMRDKQASIASLIVVQNEQRAHQPAKPHQTLARFHRRQHKPDTRTFPVYRMTRERYMLFLQALSRWQQHVRALAREYTDVTRQRDYQLELADLAAMLASLPRAAPYDVCIQRNEWDVVSRALRHFATDPAQYRPAMALYTHWHKHRGAGYLSHRRRPHENQTS